METAGTALRDAGLQAARYLLEDGHDDFWALAVVLSPDHEWLCLVSHKQDFIEVISAFDQRLTVRLLDAPRHDDQAEYDQGLGHTVRELQRLATTGGVLGAAVVTNGFCDPPSEDGPVDAVWVHVECVGGAPVCWLLPYDAEGDAPVWSELVEGPPPCLLLLPDKQAEPGAAADGGA